MIILNMIVKNEAHCIARCLASVLPHVDDVVICDTGSTDGTLEILDDIVTHSDLDISSCVGPLEWEGFGPTRTAALEHAREHANPGDWALFIDADETWEGRLPTPAELEGYDVVSCRAIGGAGIWCYRNLLANFSVPWKFTPITHETLVPADGRKVRELNWTEGHIVQHDDSARRNSGRKGPEDVELLEAWTRDNPLDARAWFYLARSYEMVGDSEKAFSAYAKRCEMRTGDPQEVVVSRLFMGKIQTVQGDPLADQNYMLAYRHDPFRAEALCGLAANCIERRDIVGAEMAARQACALPEPPGRIFSEQAAYDWIRWDLLIQATTALGRHDEARRLFAEHATAMPASEHERYAIIAKTLGLAGDNLTK